LKFSARSDCGRVREKNEDSFLVLFEQCNIRYPVFLVADGMGGHNGGEIASSMLTEYIKNKILDNPERLQAQDERESFIKEIIHDANKIIFLKSKEETDLSGMGTTITMAVLLDSEVLFAHAGDSRAYIIRESEIIKVTEDHSYVQELVNSGQISSEEAEIHPKRNMITRAIGTEDDIEIDFYLHSIQSGDYIVLCSDGLTNMVEQNEIIDILHRQCSVENKVTELINLANDRGGTDNITVIVLSI